MKTNNSPRLLCQSLLKALVTIVLLILPGTFLGQIFVSGGKGNNTVGKYNLDGTIVNGSLISTGLDAPAHIALSGSNLFVVNFNSHILGKYNLDGTPMNTSLISGLANTGAIAVSDSNLFILTGGTVREYTTDGELVNASLITGLFSPTALEISGSNLFVVTGNNTIAQYTTSGALVNPSLITGLASPSDIAVSGTDLFVTSFGLGTIGHYTILGETINTSLVSGLNSPIDIEVLGSNLFVLNNGSHTIGQYTTSGATVNASLITGLRDPVRNIAVVPEPSAGVFLIAGAAVLLSSRVRSRMRAIESRKRLVILTISLVLPLATGERVAAQAVRTDTAYTSTTAVMLRPGYGTFAIAGPWDDGSTAAVNLGFTLNFLGVSSSSIIINNNGNITFTYLLPQYTPIPNPFTVNNVVGAIIGPFLADVDTRAAYALGGTDPNIKLVTYGTSSVNYGGSVGQRTAFGINWVGVGYFGDSDENTDKLNDFQLIIIDRSDTGAANFDFEYNYDKIQWETGDASSSDGHNGVGGNSARVGFSNDAGISYEFPGSGINSALLDDSPSPETALINNSLNSGVPAVPGRYVFQVRNNVNKPVAYWKGSGSSWNGSNWTVDQAGTTALTGVPETTTDVIFSAASSSTPSTTLGANFSIHSLTMNDSRAVTIASSTNTLTLTNGGLITPSGRNGITVDAGAGAVNITSSLVLVPGNETITEVL